MSFLSSLFVLLPALCLAQVVPTTPGPGQTFKAGESCIIEWHPDTTGTWRSLTIDLMSGSNDNMSSVTNVASGLDGNSLSSYTWKCPQVDPHAAIYFYQFSQDKDASTAWTTRFAIVSATGIYTTPEHSTQLNGDAIPWGIGHLTSAEEADSSTTSSAVATTIAEMVLPAISSPKPSTTPAAQMDAPEVTLNVPPTRLRKHARRFGVSESAMHVQGSHVESSFYRSASILSSRKRRCIHQRHSF